MDLSLTLLGSFTAQASGGATPGSISIAATTSGALLAYLAAESQRPHSREQLSALFWPDAPQATAFANLRQSLIRLRRSLGAVADTLLEATQLTLQINPATDIDVATFEQLLHSCHHHAHVSITSCPECIARLQQAARLYRGEFLQGLSFAVSTQFDAWLAHKRADLHRKAQDIADTLTSHAVSSAIAPPAISQHDWQDVPLVEALHGRDAELDQLRHWLFIERCRLISILGIGGIGKTTLAAAAIRTQPDGFDRVLWHSVVNAPPLGDTLRSWLHTLSQQQLAQLPESLDEQVSLLVQHLGKQRCLLVLDNVESLFLSSQHAGTFRPGYEDYAQLIHRIGSGEHQSCLLITSREQPQGVSELIGRHEKVRMLKLSGIDAQAGRAILEAHAVRAADPATAALIQRYSGNPLALQLVASTISDFFGGSVTAFQNDVSGVFGDIRAVLDEQYARLSGLEQTVLTWLAIERDATTLDVLCADLVPPHPREAILAAVGSLRRRSLIERIQQPTNAPDDARYSLQNVVMEYVTARLISDALSECLSGELRRLCTHALVKAQAREHVRRSQERLMLQPVARQLADALGDAPAIAHVKALIAQLRGTLAAGSYAAGNLLNLLIALRADLSGCELSQLSVWQANLSGVTAHAINFAGADLSGSRFSNPFSAVWAVACSPSGSLIAGGSLDGVIYLWRNDTGEAVGLLHGHQALIYAVAFSPDGRLLASASEDGSVRVWRVADGEPVHVHRDHGAIAYTVAFSPDSARLACGCDDGSVHVWDAHTGAIAHVLRGHAGRVNKVAYSPDGDCLASASADESIRLWDSVTGDVTRTLHGHDQRIEALAFSPRPVDGRVLLASGGADNTVRVWDATTGENITVFRGHEDFITALAFGPDGRTVASGSGDQTVRLWDVSSGEALRMLQAQSGRVWSVAINPDGRSLVSGGWDHAVRVWDLHSGQPLHQLTGTSVAATALAVNDSGAVQVGTIDGEHVNVWDAGTGRTQWVLSGHTKPVRVIAMSLDGRALVSAGLDRSVRTWDLRTGALMHRFDGHRGRVESVALSPDGRLAASGSFDQTVRVWDNSPVAGTGALHTFVSQDGIVWSLALSHDNRLLAGGGETRICIWNLQDGRLLHVLPGHQPICQALAFSPDGNVLASGGQDQTIHLWDVATSRLHHTLRRHTGTIEALAFSPDGAQLVSASADHSLCLWDVRNGTLARQLTGHASWVMCAAMLPGHAQIVSGASDGILKFWDAASGACVRTASAMPPYHGMNISGARGISDAQKAALRALGAI